MFTIQTVMIVSFVALGQGCEISQTEDNTYTVESTGQDKSCTFICPSGVKVVFFKQSSGILVDTENCGVLLENGSLKMYSYGLPASIICMGHKIEPFERVLVSKTEGEVAISSINGDTQILTCAEHLDDPGCRKKFYKLHEDDTVIFNEDGTLLYRKDFWGEHLPLSEVTETGCNTSETDPRTGLYVGVLTVFLFFYVFRRRLNNIKAALG